MNTRKYSYEQEQRIAKLLNGKVNANSGATDFYKGDVRTTAFLVECKTTHDTTFNFAKLKQYDKLLEYKDKKGVYPGVVIWFVELDLIVWVNISEIEKMKLEGKKSVSPKSLELNDYTLYQVPAKKKRTFFVLFRVCTIFA